MCYNLRCFILKMVERCHEATCLKYLNILPEVIRSPSWISISSLSQKIQIFEFIPVEIPRNEETFTSYYNHSLSCLKDVESILLQYKTFISREYLNSSKMPQMVVHVDIKVQYSTQILMWMENHHWQNLPYVANKYKHLPLRIVFAIIADNLPKR